MEEKEKALAFEMTIFKGYCLFQNNVVNISSTLQLIQLYLRKIRGSVGPKH